jgi:hypothetical protein
MSAISIQRRTQLRANPGDDADLRAEDDRGLRRREPDGLVRRRELSIFTRSICGAIVMKQRVREGAEFLRLLRERRAAAQ